MENALVITLMAIILGASQPALAQSGTNAYPQQKTTEDVSSIENKFEKCMNDPDCSLKERLQIVSDIGNDMDASVQRMRQTCAIMDYNECISPQRDETQQWYKMNSHAREMMKSMEMRSLSQYDNARKSPDEKQSALDKYGEEMNEREPSAGNSKPTEKNPWWKFMSR